MRRPRSHGLQSVIEEACEEAAEDFAHVPLVDHTDAVLRARLSLRDFLLGLGDLVLGLVFCRVDVRLETPELLVSALFLLRVYRFILLFLCLVNFLFNLFLDVFELLFGFLGGGFSLVDDALAGSEDLVRHVESLRHFGEEHRDLATEVVGKRSVVETGHAHKLAVNVCELALLKCDARVRQHVDRVQDEHVENFVCSCLSGERVEVVGRDVEALEQRVGRGEAIGQVNFFARLGLRARLQRVVHALHEAEPVGVGGAGVERDGPQIDAQALAEALVDLVGPAEALHAHLPILIVQVAQPRTERALQPILHAVGARLRPLGAVARLCAL